MATPSWAAELTKWAAEERLDTPTLLFSPAAVHAAVAGLRTGLDARISYATKANAHPRMLRELAPLVDEFNVTNLAHLDALLAAGVHPDRVTYLHPVIPADTARRAVERGVTRFVVDDTRGLDRLLATGAPVRLTLRLLPPDRGESTRSVVRFGNTADGLRAVARAAVDASARLEGLSFFVGTAGAGLERALPYRRGIEALARLRDDLDRDGVPVDGLTVNIGGGFPGARRRFHLDHPDFFGHIAAALGHHFGPGADVVCEPGRYLSEPSLVMLARVVADREVAGRRMVYLDASAYGGLFEHCFVDVGGDGLHLWAPAGAAASTEAVVLGPVMDSFDVVKRRALLPPLRDGDPVVLPNVGAYSWGYTAGCEGLRPPDVCDLPDRLDGEYAATWYD